MEGFSVVQQTQFVETKDFAVYTMLENIGEFVTSVITITAEPTTAANEFNAVHIITPREGYYNRLMMQLALNRGQNDSEDDLQDILETTISAHPGMVVIHEKPLPE